MSKTTNYKGATILLPEEEVEDQVFDYLDDMESHPAINLEDIVIMPDCHIEPNSRTIVGFTAEFKDKIAPQFVGSDIGCGVSAVPLTESLPEEEWENVAEQVETTIPLGRGQYWAENRNELESYNIKEDFPFKGLNSKLKSLVNSVNVDFPLIESFLDKGGYSFEWFNSDFANRIHFDMNEAINGVGSLGGGNHFIEVSRDDSDRQWIVTHTGSRGIGGAVSGYHKYQAERFTRSEKFRDKLRNISEKYKQYLQFNVEEVSNEELFEWGTRRKIYDMDQIKHDFEGEAIERVRQELSISFPDAHPWDYVEGEQLEQYCIDMLFAQVYAEENRKKIIEDVCMIAGVDATWSEFINSPHNLLDYRDGVIRKGSTNAEAGRKGVIPFNMDDGAVIVTGIGEEQYNSSVPHGAGRPMSRGDARELFEDGKINEPETFSVGADPSEYPGAYKQTELVYNVLQEIANIETTLQPIVNMKGNN